MQEESVKRTFITLVLLAVFVCLTYVPLCNASAGEARFGTGVTSDWKLINEAREFDTNLITCGFFGTKPFGTMSVVVSIYHQEKPGATESILERVTLEINPEWDVMLLPELPLPDIGKYTFTLSTAGGDSLASGSVTITEKKVEEKMPEQPKVEGTTLEGLFKKFKPGQ